jgi:hypothetical protein
MHPGGQAADGAGSGRCAGTQSAERRDTVRHGVRCIIRILISENTIYEPDQAVETFVPWNEAFGGVEWVVTTVGGNLANGSTAPEHYTSIQQ